MTTSGRTPRGAWPVKPELGECASSARPRGLRVGPKAWRLAARARGRFRGITRVQENLTPPGCAFVRWPRERLRLAPLQPGGQNPRPRRALPTRRGDARYSLPREVLQGPPSGCGRFPTLLWDFSVRQTEFRNPKAPLLSLLKHFKAERAERSMETGIWGQVRE